MTLVPVTLHPEARVCPMCSPLLLDRIFGSLQELYDAIEELSRGRFQNMLSDDGGSNTVREAVYLLLLSIYHDACRRTFLAC
jgi:N-acyl-L-homoserine lactone synthetase